MSLVLTTASVPDRDKVAYWNDAASRTLVPMTVAPRGDGPFDGRIATDRLGYLQVSTMEADAERVSRMPALIARSSKALVAVGVQISGTATFVQDGRRAEVGEGDLVVYDTTRPYSFAYPQRFATHVFQLPRRMLGVPDSDIRQVTGNAVGTGDGFGAMLLPFLATLASSLTDGYPPAVANRLAGNGLAAADHAERPRTTFPPNTTPLSSPLEERIRCACPGKAAGQRHQQPCRAHSEGRARHGSPSRAAGQWAVDRTASWISSATALGWESMTRCEESTSTVVIPARS
ncbi:hypothetical protein NGF19_12885 [Streptomyces sp. RY43-2]|uniref:Transcription regulator HTH AraC- type ligand binding domain-containing protein n=1 Tax=Streptomyces macrolidinus TaxID=2952607 RepID=A0ABT0ZDM9_9ACTN|nr:hypothetical protein [Streptomyces macrolidinus]MCN9241677.1 hypothetical protein [Streptomyces macrolidinus]